MKRVNKWKEITQLTLLNFFAIFSVVVIHVFPRDSQIGLFILDNVSRFAVPFFFTASGYLFGKKMIHTRDSIDYFKRYIIKILKLYLCWLFFYMMYDVLILYKVATDALKDLRNTLINFHFLILYIMELGLADTNCGF